MFKIHFPCDVINVGRVSGHAILNGGSFPLHTTAENAKRADDFVKLANRIVANVDAHPPPSPREESSDFAKKFCEAVQRQLGSRSRQHNTAAASDEETFAQKLTRITKEKARQRGSAQITRPRAISNDLA